jgi:type I restriction enzyme S subunit
MGNGNRLPDGWRYLTVDEIKANSPSSVAIGPFGSRMKSDRYVANGVPVIRGNNISNTRELKGDFVYVDEQTADELRSSAAYVEDLVFPHRGLIGEVAIVPPRPAERYILSTYLFRS